MKLPRNWRFPATVCTTPFRKQHKWALTRIEREMGGPGAQLSKRTSALVTSLRNRRLIGPQLAASLNGTRKTPVSTSTVKRQLRDAGLLGRVTKKKPYLRLANKRKRLGWTKEYRHWTEEDWKKVLWTDKFWGVWITQKNICEMQNKWKGGVQDLYKEKGIGRLSLHFATPCYTLWTALHPISSYNETM